MPYVDVKMTIWERYYYKEGTDPRSIIHYQYPGDQTNYNYNGFCKDNHPNFSYSDFLYETVEELSYYDNENQTTVEMYNDKGEQVWTNEPIEEKRDSKIDEIIERKNEY